MKALLLAFALLAPPLCAQGWNKTDKTDAFTGNSYVQYALTGRFLRRRAMVGRLRRAWSFSVIPTKRSMQASGTPLASSSKPTCRSARCSTIQGARFQSCIGATTAKRI